MRVPKDAFFVHQVMWDGWVTPEHNRTYIVGHWNYKPGTVKDVYVVSTADRVSLLLNGKELKTTCERSQQWLFTFKDVAFEEGTLEAVGYTEEAGSLTPTSSHKLDSAGKPAQLRLTAIANPQGMVADGADMVLVQVEAIDQEGHRCPTDNRTVSFYLWGEGQWIGSIEDSRLTVPLVCGVNRVLVRSTTTAGEIGLAVCADGLKPAYLTVETHPVEVSQLLPQLTLPCRLDRGETPATPSYTDLKRSVTIVGATVGSNAANAANSYDDNELSEWKSDGKKENAWVTYRLSRKAAIDEIALKLTGWRNKCYPLQVLAGRQIVWEGLTDATLGYTHIKIDKPVKSDRLTIRMTGPSVDSSLFGESKELAGGKAAELDALSRTSGKVELRIVEADLTETIQ